MGLVESRAALYVVVVLTRGAKISRGPEACVERKEAGFLSGLEAAEFYRRAWEREEG